MATLINIGNNIKVNPKFISYFEGLEIVLANKHRFTVTADVIELVKAYVENRNTGALHYKGKVSSVSNLPSTGNIDGDMYLVTGEDKYYAWNGTSWDETPTIVNISSLQSSLASEVSRAQAKEAELQEAIADQNDEIEDFKSAITDQVNNYQPVVIEGDVTNAADEEDITSENNLLKLKNRSALNGMGYVILRRGSSFASQVTLPNTIYEVRYNFDLGGGNVSIPSNCVLQFTGGSVNNGTIQYNNTNVIGIVNYTNVSFSGSVSNDIVVPELFGAKGDGITDDSYPLQYWINNGGNISLSAGKTYLIGTIINRGVDNYRNGILRIHSNTHIQGNGARIKLIDNLLSGADTNNTHFIVGDDVENITISNCLFDGNGVNNITPKREGSIVLYRSSMFIRLSGGRNITIKDNVFTDCAGHNMIVLSNGVHNFDNEKPSVFENAIIENNEFRSGGKYLSNGEEAIYNEYNQDFSFLYTDFKYSIVKNNLFVNWDLDKDSVGEMNKEDRYKYLSGKINPTELMACGGVELHNTDQQAIGNTFIGCQPAIYICANTQDINNTIIKGNAIKDCLSGIIIVGADNMVHNQYYNTIIESNELEILSTEESNSYGIRYSTTTSSNPTISIGLIIRNNTITSSLYSIDNINENYKLATAINIDASHENTTIDSNIIKDFIGVAISTFNLVSGTHSKNVNIVNNFISSVILKIGSRQQISCVGISLYNERNATITNVIVRNNVIKNEQKNYKSEGNIIYAFAITGTGFENVLIDDNTIDLIPYNYNSIPNGVVYYNVVHIKSRNGNYSIRQGDYCHDEATNIWYGRGFGYTTPLYDNNNKLSCTGAIGSNTLSTTAESNLKIGDYCKITDNSTGTQNVYIIAIDGTTITLSSNATINATGIEQNKAALQEYPLNYGTSSNRPTLGSYVNVGFSYWDLTLKKIIFWGADHWADANGFSPNKIVGATSERPTLTTADKGFQYFDTDLEKPIYWTGAKWVDATGADLT